MGVRVHSGGRTDADRPPDATTVRHAEFAAEWSHLLVDPVRQLRTLADMFEGGLLSRVEYERYKRHVRGL